MDSAPLMNRPTESSLVNSAVLLTWEINGIFRIVTVQAEKLCVERSECMGVCDEVGVWEGGYGRGRECVGGCDEDGAHEQTLMAAQMHTLSASARFNGTRQLTKY